MTTCSFQEHRLRGAQDIVRHHAVTDLEPEARDPARFHDWMAIYSVDEVCLATWQCNQVVERKGTRLFRFSSLSGKDARRSRCHGEVEIKNSNIFFFSKSNEHGEPFEFERNIFPQHTIVEILRETQMRMTTRRTRLEEFVDRIIFMWMFNDIDWIERGFYRDWFFEIWNGKRLRKEISVRKITNLKDSGILVQMSWLPADVQSSELPVRWIGDSWRICEVHDDSFQCGSFECSFF